LIWEKTFYQQIGPNCYVFCKPNNLSQITASLLCRVVLFLSRPARCIFLAFMYGIISYISQKFLFRGFSSHSCPCVCVVWKKIGKSLLYLWPDGILSWGPSIYYVSIVLPFSRPTHSPQNRLNRSCLSVTLLLPAGFKSRSLAYFAHREI
jgi:hypothetical protein